jgi:hypothetical protein
LINVPSGSVKIMDRLPHGCVAGGMTQSTPSASIRGYSASVSATSKSRIISGWGVPPGQCLSEGYSVKRRREKPTDAAPAGTST